jgi:hypothetical protein
MKALPSRGKAIISQMKALPSHGKACPRLMSV